VTAAGVLGAEAGQDLTGGDDVALLGHRHTDLLGAARRAAVGVGAALPVDLGALEPIVAVIVEHLGRGLVHGQLGRLPDRRGLGLLGHGGLGLGLLDGGLDRGDGAGASVDAEGGVLVGVAGREGQEGERCEAVHGSSGGGMGIRGHGRG
jgi:hypothetical protein